MFSRHIRRELLLSVRSRHDWINTLIFFVMVTALLPLATGSELASLSKIGGGIIWITALLATLLSLDQLFRDDHEDGVLDQMLLSPDGLFEPVISKIIIHWFITGLPLAVISPLLAMMFGMSVDVAGILFVSLAIGTPYFSCIGAIGAALTVSLKKSGLIPSLIIMPLYIPVLILGAGTVRQVIEGYNPSGPLFIIGALSVFAFVLAPFVIMFALRVSADG